jgi:hypothetical protein
MRGLKLFVSLFFVLFALTFFGQRWFTASSAGKNPCRRRNAFRPKRSFGFGRRLRR